MGDVCLVTTSSGLSDKSTEVEGPASAATPSAADMSLLPITDPCKTTPSKCVLENVQQKYQLSPTAAKFRLCIFQNTWE